jgi:hypothetical protein
MEARKLLMSFGRRGLLVATVISRSLMPRISAACHQVIFFAIACNITSCTFIARSIAALG